MARPESAVVDVAVDRPHVLTLSARTALACDESAARLAAHLAGPAAELDDARFADVALTTNVGRAHLSHRLVVVAAEADAAARAIGDHLAGDIVDGVVAGVAPDHAPEVAFLFTGHGSQYPRMGRDLDVGQPTYRAALDRCAQLLEPLMDRPLRDVLYDEGADGRPALLDDMAYAQPALFAVEYALAELWRSWGVAPTVVVGHSVGEYVAAVVAGVMSLDDGLRLVAARGRLMASLPKDGAMATVFADEARVRAAIAPAGGLVSIAAVNGPQSIALSGIRAALDAVLDELRAEGVEVRPLAVPVAAHSPQVEPILDAFEAVAARITYGAPQLEVVSGMTGQVASGDDLVTAGYWRRHLRQPVRFADALRTAFDGGARIFVEAGPHPSLLGMGRHVVPEHECAWLPSLRRTGDAWAQLLQSAAALHVRGVGLDWLGVAAPTVRHPVVLPTYPFERERYWIEARDERVRRPPAGDHPLLGARLDSPALADAVFETELVATNPAFLDDHRVFGTVLLPAPAFVEMALAAGAALAPDLDAVTDLEIRDPLVLGDDARRAVQVVVRTATDGRPGAGSVFDVVSRDAVAPVGAGVWVVHATGRLAPIVADDASSPPPFDVAAVQARCDEHVDGAAFYAGFVAAGLDIGPSFRGVAEVWRRDGEALGRIVRPAVLTAEPAARQAAYHAHPALLDACFHVVAATVPADGDVHLLVGVERIRVLAPLTATMWSHVVVRPAGEQAAGSLLVDLDVVDEHGTVLVRGRGLHLRRASREALRRATHRVDPDWFYEVRWLADAVASEPATLVGPLAAEVAILQRQHGVDEHLARIAALDRRATWYVRHALDELGWSAAPGERTSTADLAARLGVAPRHHRLFDRLLGMLADDGALVRSSDGWEVVGPVAAGASEPDVAAATVPDPVAGDEAELVERCGARLADVLRGDADPVGLLFPGGSSEALARIYRDSPPARVVNTLVGDAVAAAIAARPADRPPRVLEIGAGTGATTLSVLPVLPAGSEYWFTDVSPAFTVRAADRFGDAITARPFDVERGPGGQGIPLGTFDVVVAANVLHATTDLRASLANARALLAPGGTLVLVEGGQPSRWVDVTFGLTEGWWRFADHDLRPSHPLLGRDPWLRLLGQCGFVGATSITGEPDGDVAGQAVIVAGLAPHLGTPPDEHDRWLVLADAAGLGGQLVDALRGEGRRVERLDPDATADRLGQAIAADPTARCRVVHVVADGAPPDQAAHLKAAQVQAITTDLVVGALRTSRAVIDADAPCELWVVTRGAQPVDATPPRPEHAAVWGFGRVLALEQPERWGGLVDLEPGGDPAADARALSTIIRTAGDEDQLAVRGGLRHVGRLVRREHPTTPAAPVAWRADASYLVTGGLGGLGLKVARWLAAAGAGSIVLLGRTALEPRERWAELDPGSRAAVQAAAITAIEALGATVTTVAADVADPAAMAALMARFGADLPELRGVFHVAAALGNWGVAAMPDEAVDTMLRPKVAGTWLLDELTRGLPLDVFVLFSSTTALWGSRDLAHYAAANQFLDAFAHVRHAAGRPALSVNWGTWDEMRVATAEERASVARAGLLAMPSDGALAALDELLARADCVQMAVAAVDWTLLKGLYEARRPRPFLAMVAAPEVAVPRGRRPAEPVLAARLAQTVATGHHDVVVSFLREEVARALGVAQPEGVDIDQGLFDMGMDSLMSVELKGRIETAVGSDLPSTLTFNYPNVRALAGYLLTEVLDDSHDEEPPGVDAAPPVADRPALELDDDMTEDELAALLAARLSELR